MRAIFLTSLMKCMAALTLAILICGQSSMTAFAEDAKPVKGKSYGIFMFFEEIPNALFFDEKIVQNDGFEFRKAIRNHDIDTIVLLSPGGSIWEGLTIAGMIFDKKLTTFVPEGGRCTSACAFMFFAGNKRHAAGRLGVHQFYSTDGEKSDKIKNIQFGSQFTTSEIIGFLNEFGTPPFVFEKMFAQQEMYFFSDNELAQVNTDVSDEVTQKSFTKIYNFVAEAKDALAREKTKSEEKTDPTEITITEKVIKDEKIAVMRKKIQSELNRIGCKLGKVDGIIGSSSKSALARFNKLNNSSYNADSFFTDESQYIDLKSKSNNFCPSRSEVAVEKREQPNQKTLKSDDENTTNWTGTSYCTMIVGRQNESMKLTKISETEYQMLFSGEKEPLRFKLSSNGKYKALGDGAVRSKFSFEIDEELGYITGRSNLNMMGTLLTLTVGASGVCKYEFYRNE
jgi:hypothetical protein